MNQNLQYFFHIKQTHTSLRLHYRHLENQISDEIENWIISKMMEVSEIFIKLKFYRRRKLNTRLFYCYSWDAEPSPVIRVGVDVLFMRGSNFGAVV